QRLSFVADAQPSSMPSRRTVTSGLHTRERSWLSLPGMEDAIVLLVLIRPILLIPDICNPWTPCIWTMHLSAVGTPRYRLDHPVIFPPGSSLCCSLRIRTGHYRRQRCHPAALRSSLPPSPSACRRVQVFSCRWVQNSLRFRKVK